MRSEPNDQGKLLNEEYELDPVFISSRREACAVLIVFAVFAIYVLSVCYWLGTRSEPIDGQPIATILGLPIWVFWGILMPWGAANVVTVWYCFFFMRPDSLEEPGEGEINLEQPRE